MNIGQGGFDDPEKKDNLISLPDNPSRNTRTARRHPLRSGKSDPPRRAPGEEASPQQPGPSLEEQLVRLSSFGMTEEEIRRFLEEEIEENGFTTLDVTTAIERGRALGLAEIKEAQYRAALQGKVSAQGKVLTMLGTEKSKNGGEVRNFEVVRRIIPSGKDPV